jgi:hypothetical protein
MVKTQHARQAGQDSLKIIFGSLGNPYLNDAAVGVEGAEDEKVVIAL